MSDWLVIQRIIGAAFLGGIVGFEREWHHKPAGLRTIMLVTMGAAMVLLLAQRIPDFIAPNVDTVTMDPSRILAGLVQGIGFLGAGTIFMARRTVHGLTTAATVWAMAIVGAAAGVGDWTLAITGTLMAFAILRVLGALEFPNKPLPEKSSKRADNKG